MALGDFDHEGYEYMKHVLAESLGVEGSSLPIICNRNLTPLALRKALELSCEKLISIFVNETCVKIDRISTARLTSNAISTYLWNRTSPHAKADGNIVLEYARSAIAAVIEEADAQAKHNDNTWSFWPPSEFVSENGVEGYFPNDATLPIDWKSSLRRSNLEGVLDSMSRRLTGSFRDVIESLLFEAPKGMRDACSVLMAQGYYRRCLQEGLEWLANHSDSSSDCGYVYLPRGLLEVIIGQLASHQELVPALLIPPDYRLGEAIDPVTFVEQQFRPNSPQDGRFLLSSTNNKRRRQFGSPEKRQSQNAESTSPADSPFGGGKKPRASDNHAPIINQELEDSSVFSKKLQDLLNGDTVDFLVGDHYLSSILRHVPKLAMD